MANIQTLEVPIRGMDCVECTQHVQHAISKLDGVKSVDVLLAAEKAIIQLDPEKVGLPAIRKAVASAGDEYSVPETNETLPNQPMGDFNKQLITLLVIVFSIVLSIVIFGEWLGLFKLLDSLVPFPVGLIIVLAGGYPIFRNVIRVTFKGQIISHTLMTLGVIAALAVGEWVTAAIVVVLMRVGEYVENFTTEGARRAVKELTSIAPQTARVERNGEEIEIPVAEVKIDEVVITRPGEKIPVDGEVVSGEATIDQAAITGESMPVEVTKGNHVFAATITKLGSLRIKTLKIGTDTTFGRVVKMVEEAEANRANVQQFADKFSTYYLPIVIVIATLTFLISGNPLSTAAVLVVACSCSIALATPVAMLASIGGSAKRGLLIKGGKYLEVLARADVILVDKTGTLTLGQPKITDVISLNGLSETEILTLAASAERYSEHPLAEAVRVKARIENIKISDVEDFEAITGQGIRAKVNGSLIEIGNRRLVSIPDNLSVVQNLEETGKTLLFISRGKQLVGILAASDTLRSEVPTSIIELRKLGINKIELLTGDNERTASALANQLGIEYRASLLPENKIEIVKEYQSKGHIVVMIGDGVNDAPALAQSNIGISMGAGGTDIAIEASHIALLREDWTLIPEVIGIARRTMGIIKMNLGFTAVYNVVGLTLAAFGFLPPVLAAAAQSLPDIGILTNSARLINQKK
ncbi:MAG: cadmium-translocating P-type ATPase [Anaerolineales bacterium]|nr:cadmium-translocating P-type ATPase [Anaerolineales bacterium]